MRRPLPRERQGSTSAPRAGWTGHCPAGGYHRPCRGAVESAFWSRRATQPWPLIDEDWCIGCTLCIKACPTDAIVGANKLMHTVMPEHCTGCELCIPVCPVDCMAAGKRQRVRHGLGCLDASTGRTGPRNATTSARNAWPAQRRATNRARLPTAACKPLPTLPQATRRHRHPATDKHCAAIAAAPGKGARAPRRLNARVSRLRASGAFQRPSVLYTPQPTYRSPTLRHERHLGLHLARGRVGDVVFHPTRATLACATMSLYQLIARNARNVLHAGPHLGTGCHQRPDRFPRNPGQTHTCRGHERPGSCR
jgi:Pyruvate/2-oxoacid:ferredoxin oxidoreductase delta subunit